MFLKEFKKFALKKGNAVDMAIGIIIGAAFGKIVSSLVDDIIMPPLGMILGKVDFSNLSFIIQNKTAAHPLIAIKYGLFVNKCVDFCIISLSIFIIVKYMNKIFQIKEKTAETKPCSFCYSTIHIKAMRCPQCTSKLIN